MKKQSKFKSTNYIVIQGFMIVDLNLSGNELLAYAIIYGFSQDEEGKFEGSMRYLSTAMNCSIPTARKAVKSLVNSGLITKEDVYINNVKFCEYKVALQVVKNLYRGGKESLQGGGKESFYNNTNLNNNRDRESALENWEEKARSRSQLKAKPLPELRAFEWLREAYPTRYEQEFAMRFSNELNRLSQEEQQYLIDSFNDKVDIENLPYEPRVLFGRLRSFSRNWLRNNEEAKRKNINKGKL